MTRLRVGGYLDGGGWRLLNADEEDFYNIHTMAMDKEHEEDDYFCWLAGWLTWGGDNGNDPGKWLN